MTDFEFRAQLTDNQFRRQNRFTDDNPRDTTFLWTRTDYTPYIMAGNMDIHPEGILHIPRTVQFGGRVISRPKITEILNSSRYPLRIHVGEKWYHVGKGYIGREISDYNTQPLLVYTVPSDTYSNMEMSDVTIIVDPLYKEEENTIRLIIDKCLAEAAGDIIRTTDICKFITGQINIPTHRSLNERRAYERDFVNKLIDTL